MYMYTYLYYIGGRMIFKKFIDSARKGKSDNASALAPVVQFQSSSMCGMHRTVR
jgi:hypothetical protein